MLVNVGKSYAPLPITAQQPRNKSREVMTFLVQVLRKNQALMSM
ncbi:hypothetical protein [[Phormidium] sp. LEGE 05292]|nr:hypothetical protein [Phormidium sp. LEGE 05292]